MRPSSLERLLSSILSRQWRRESIRPVNRIRQVIFKYFPRFHSFLQDELANFWPPTLLHTEFLSSHLPRFSKVNWLTSMKSNRTINWRPPPPPPFAKCAGRYDPWSTRNIGELSTARMDIWDDRLEAWSLQIFGCIKNIFSMSASHTDRTIVCNKVRLWLLIVLT